MAIDPSSASSKVSRGQKGNSFIYGERETAERGLLSLERRALPARGIRFALQIFTAQPVGELGSLCHFLFPIFHFPIFHISYFLQVVGWTSWRSCYDVIYCCLLSDSCHLYHYILSFFSAVFGLIIYHLFIWLNNHDKAVMGSKRTALFLASGWKDGHCGED